VTVLATRSQVGLIALRRVRTARPIAVRLGERLAVACFTPIKGAGIIVVTDLGLGLTLIANAGRHHTGIVVHALLIPVAIAVARQIGGELAAIGTHVVGCAGDPVGTIHDGPLTFFCLRVAGVDGARVPVPALKVVGAEDRTYNARRSPSFDLLKLTDGWIFGEVAVVQGALPYALLTLELGRRGGFAVVAIMVRRAPHVTTAGQLGVHGLNAQVQLFIAVGFRAIKLVATIVGCLEVIPTGIAVMARLVTQLAGETAAGAIGFKVDVITLVRLVIADGIITRVFRVRGAIVLVETRRSGAFPGVQRGVNTRRRADIARVGGAIVEITAVRCGSAAIDNLGVDAIRVDAVVHGTRATIITVGVRCADAGAGRVDARTIGTRIRGEVGVVVARGIRLTTARQGLHLTLAARQTNPIGAGIGIDTIQIILAAHRVARDLAGPIG
jgi:hypothetical protein